MFGKLKSTLDKSVAAVSVKSESLVETSRTKTAINNAQQKMGLEFNALGQKVYSLWRTGQDLTDIKEDLKRIQELEGEIADLEKRLVEIKEEESRLLATPQANPVPSGHFCSNCGKALAAGSRFCDECGTPVNG